VNQPLIKVAFGLFVSVIAGMACAEQAIYSCQRADGSVELTTRRDSAQCELIAGSESTAAAAPTPAAAAPAPEKSADAAPAADTAKAATGNANAETKAQASEAKADAKADPVEDPRKHYRDAIIQAVRGDGTTSSLANRSVGRRYLAITRNDYMKANGDGQSQSQIPGQ
jgi:hypothetical protein